MKDFPAGALSVALPEISAEQCLGLCLGQLFKDDRHFLAEEVVEGLTFKMLIGALLIAKDELDELACDRCQGDPNG